jgi:hypothetical protein
MTSEQLMSTESGALTIARCPLCTSRHDVNQFGQAATI